MVPGNGLQAVALHGCVARVVPAHGSVAGVLRNPDLLAWTKRRGGKGGRFAFGLAFVELGGAAGGEVEFKNGNEGKAEMKSVVSRRRGVDITRRTKQQIRAASGPAALTHIAQLERRQAVHGGDRGDALSMRRHGVARPRASRHGGGIARCNRLQLHHKKKKRQIKSQHRVQAARPSGGFPNFLHSDL